MIYWLGSESIHHIFVFYLSKMFTFKVRCLNSIGLSSYPHITEYVPFKNWVLKESNHLSAIIENKGTCISENEMLFGHS